MWKKTPIVAIVLSVSAAIAAAQDSTGSAINRGLPTRGPSTYANNPTGYDSSFLTQYQTPGNGNTMQPTDPGAAAFGSASSSDRALRGWFSGDYMMLFPSPLRSPSLLQNGTGANLIGVSSVLGIANGVRIDSGLWLSEERLAMQGISFFTFDSYATAFQPAGTIPLAGPIPPADVTNFNYTAWHRLGGGEGNMLYRFGDAGGDSHLYGLIGTKFMMLEEDVKLTYSMGNQEVGGDFLDEFHTRNQFIGGQVGLMFSRRTNRLSLDVTGKVAIGENIAQLTVLGSNTAGTNFQAFTGPSNIGFFETGYFSVIPEVNVNVSYNLTDRLTAHVGYNFMCWVNVWRPGDQISLNNDGGVSVPAATLLNSTYFLHGLNAGVTFRY